MTLRLDLGSSAVWDDRPPGAWFSVSPDVQVCNRPRLPLGHFVLDNFAMDRSSFRMRLRLWDGELVGSADNVDGADGSISFRVFVHAEYSEADVIAVELNHTEGTAGTPPRWRFEPAAADRPWAQRACNRTGRMVSPGKPDY